MLDEGLHLPDSDIADMRPLIQICSAPSAGFFMQNVPLARRTKATWLGNTHRAALRTDGLSPSMRSGGPSPHQSRLPARFTAQGVNPLGPGVLFFYIAGLLTSEIVLNPLVFESQWVMPIDNG
jgi:hypothetical protein